MSTAVVADVTEVWAVGAMGVCVFFVLQWHLILYIHKTVAWILEIPVLMSTASSVTCLSCVVIHQSLLLMWILLLVHNSSFLIILVAFLMNFLQGCYECTKSSTLCGKTSPNKVHCLQPDNLAQKSWNSFVFKTSLCVLKSHTCRWYIRVKQLQ